MTDQLVRWSGLAAWYLLIVEVLLGAMQRGALAPHVRGLSGVRKLRRHTQLTTLVGVVVITHVAAIWMSHVRKWGIAETFTPGPVARDTALIATAALLVVVASGACRHRLGTWWRKAHWLWIVVVVSGTIHGLLAGPDHDSLPMVVPGTAAIALIAAVYAARYSKAATRRRQQRLTGHMQATAPPVPVASAAWTPRSTPSAPAGPPPRDGVPAFVRRAAEVDQAARRSTRTEGDAALGSRVATELERKQ